MDEQRIQAYVNLIRQLLDCASGEEMAVLQHHAELVDAGLLAVMQQYAEYLDSQGKGNGNAARWLLGLARQLAEAMGIVDAEVEGTPKDSVKFLLAVLQLVEDSGGDAQQVYPFLAQHQEKLNEQLLQVLPQVAARFLAGEPEQQQAVAAILVSFGNLIQQFPLGRRWLNLELGISAYTLALQVRTREAFPTNCRMTARNLGNLHFEQQAWLEAAIAYTLALQAGEILYQSAILLDGKAAELAETRDLPRRAAYALTRSGNLQAAALTLEQGRARGLSETLERDRADLTQLQQLVPALYNQYAATTTALRDLETQQRLRMTSEERHDLTPEALRTEALRLRQTLTQTIDQIREVPGYEDFLAQPSFDDIRQVLRPGIPLVYLVPTPAGSLALIVTQDDIAPLWLDDLTETRLREILVAWFKAYDQSQANHAAWLDAINQGTRQLWQPLMAPLLDHLKQRNFHQATLIPTGYLSLLPLHAAWTEAPTTPTGRHYALDAIHFTYAPNARSLKTAQDIAQRTVADSILAIDEPKHYEYKEGNYQLVEPLPNSSREVQAAIATFPNPNVLRHEQATREAILAALPHYNVLYCSCHGEANRQEPLKSGLAMTGKGEEAILTLRDLLDLKLNGIRLAILSACETGLAGTKLADEVISLPTGLLQAGVAGVVASLWKVSDLSTMVLLSRFYTLWRDQHLEPSQALIKAQQWLRDSKPRDVVAHCETFIPELASRKGELYRSLKLKFSHPYFWAAFSYMGV